MKRSQRAPVKIRVAHIGRITSEDDHLTLYVTLEVVDRAGVQMRTTLYAGDSLDLELVEPKEKK